MTELDFNPTAANILSSLRIKGVSSFGGEDKEGFVPVLTESGLLDISMLPVEQITSQISLPPLLKTAYVDTDITSTKFSTGAITAPYHKVEDAAAAGYFNFILDSGDYGTETIEFTNTSTESVIRLFSIGTSRFDTLTFKGYPPGVTFIFYNISATKINFENRATGSSSECVVTLQGYGEINELAADTSKCLTIKLDANFSLLETDSESIGQIIYLADTEKVQNKSTEVPGTTITDALDNLGTRKIEIPVFEAGSEGISVQSEQISVDDDTKTLYKLQRLGDTLKTAVNNTFYKKNDSPTFTDVTAATVSSKTVETETVTTKTLNLTSSESTNTVVRVSDDNFLVISTEED